MQAEAAAWEKKARKAAEPEPQGKKSVDSAGIPPVDFIRSKKYTGRKEGMVFKTGKKGLGKFNLLIIKIILFLAVFFPIQYGMGNNMTL